MARGLVWARDGTRGEKGSLGCLLFGHAVDNHLFAGQATRRCGCGERILSPRGDETRVRHTLSCFFGGHHYVPIGERDGHREYVCFPCGHPLLFREECDPYAGRTQFTKRVRYLCNLLGHRVHKVSDRGGHSEYACGCGHSFLIPARQAAVVWHPAVCVFAGHFVSFVGRRAGYEEFRCRNCGHTFSWTRAV